MAQTQNCLAVKQQPVHKYLKKYILFSTFHVDVNKKKKFKVKWKPDLSPIIADEKWEETSKGGRKFPNSPRWKIKIKMRRTNYYFKI